MCVYDSACLASVRACLLGCYVIKPHYRRTNDVCRSRVNYCTTTLYYDTLVLFVFYRHNKQATVAGI